MTTATDTRPLAPALATRLPWPRVLRGVRVIAGVLALGVIVAISLRVATAGAAHATFLVPSGRIGGYPSWMRGPFAGLGTLLSLRSFIVLMTVMAGAWLVVLACADALPHWVIPAAIVVATAIFTLAPPLLSSDVFNYIAYGRLAIHGVNPYAHGPAIYPGDPVYPYVGHLWAHTPSAYGPLFTAISQVLAPLGTAVSLWMMKALAGLSSLGCAALIWLTARRMGRRPALGAALFALNPLVLLWAVGGAHNDLFMALFLALAVYLAVRNAAGGAGSAVVGAVAVKLSAGLLAPFLLLGVRPRRRALIGMVAAGALAGVGAVLLYGRALTNMVHVMAQEQHFNWIVVSVPGFLGYYLGCGHLTMADRHVFLAICAAVVVALIVRTLGGRRWIEAAGWATFALLVTTGWLLPWYIVWLLPLAAVLRRRALPLAAIALTLLLLGMQLDHVWLTRNSHHHHHRHHAGLVHRAR